MGGGEHGGLQRWQLTIAHLSFGERKLHIMMIKPYSCCRAFIVKGELNSQDVETVLFYNIQVPPPNISKINQMMIMKIFTDSCI